MWWDSNMATEKQNKPEMTDFYHQLAIFLSPSRCFSVALSLAFFVSKDGLYMYILCVTQHATDDFGVQYVPFIITYSSPLPIEVDLHTTFHGRTAVH